MKYLKKGPRSEEGPFSSYTIKTQSLNLSQAQHFNYDADYRQYTVPFIEPQRKRKLFLSQVSSNPSLTPGERLRLVLTSRLHLSDMCRLSF